MLDLESLRKVNGEKLDHVTEQIRLLTARMDIPVVSGPASAFMGAAPAQDM
jgi:hypothetical protein